MTTANKTMNVRVSNKMETVFEMFDKGIDNETIAKWAGVTEGTVKTLYRVKYNKVRGIVSGYSRRSFSYFKKISVVKIDSKSLSKFENVIIEDEKFPIVRVSDDAIKYAIIEDGQLKVVEKSANELFQMKVKFS